MKPAYNSRLAWFFGPPARFAGVVIAVAGLTGVFLEGPAGWIMVLLGLLMVTTYSGVDLFLPEYQYRLFYKILFLIRIGRIKDFSHYDHLLVKPWKGSHTVYSRSNRQVDVKDHKFVVYAAEPTGKDKIPLFMSPDKQLAYKKAEHISDLTRLEFKKDSPYK